MSEIERDIEYAKTWCRNANLNMLGERIDRIADRHDATERMLREVTAKHAALVAAAKAVTWYLDGKFPMPLVLEHRIRTLRECVEGGG